MKNIFVCIFSLFLLIIFFFTSSSFAQLDVEQVYFFNSRIAWGNGPNGVMVKTTDAGEHWIQQNSGTNEFIFKVFFINKDLGWACGTNGSVIKTTNGGTSWTLLNSGVSSSHLFGICFADENKGWIAGDQGIILATQNGGASWQQQTSGAGAQFRFIQFINANEGWVCGDSGVALHTTDGGLNWIRQNTGTPYYLQWVDFVDPLNGFIAGGNYTDNSSVFLKTTDGGTTWQDKSMLDGIPLFSTNFINTQRGYVCGRGGAILETTNGGSSWISHSYDGIWFSDVYFMNQDTIYVFSPPNRVLTSTDGGYSWGMRYITISVPPVTYSLDIRDVPNDNGKQVFLKWTIDRALNNSINSDFSVWRSDQQAWTYLDEVPWQPDTVYQVIAPTLYDSTKRSGIYYSIFRVIAYTSTGYQIIGPDSGYSVDNTPPKPPKKGRSRHDNNNTVLDWEASDNTEGDLKDYIVYKSTQFDFIPSAENQLAVIQDTVYTDLSTGENIFYYKITSRDESGNESTALTISGSTGIDLLDPQIPDKYDLSQNYPNPFNPSTQIRISVKSAGYVLLQVFDVSGKEVARLISQEMDAGTYTVTFSPSNLSSGVYFYKLQTGNFSSTKKMLFMK